jgi:hypothetical protein
LTNVTREGENAHDGLRIDRSDRQLSAGNVNELLRRHSFDCEVVNPDEDGH